MYRDIHKFILKIFTLMIIFFPNYSFGYDQKDVDKLKKYNSCIHCDLAGANLSGMNLVSANLSSANLSYANLSGANLNYSILKGANLENANLENANLENARLVGSNLENIYLCGANINGIKDISPDKKQNIEDLTQICSQVDGKNGDYVDNEVEDLRKKIKAAVVDQAYISSKNKALLLNEIYNTVKQDRYLISMLNIDLKNLFTKYLNLPFHKVSDFLNTSFDAMPLDEATINKLILSLPNSSILTFRYIIQDNKQFTIDVRQRRKVIKDIDKIILNKINLQMIAYGSEKDADGKAKAINILNTPLTVATNIDTNIKFEGKFRIPTGMNSTEFNELFSWSYDNKKAKPIISGKKIQWTKAHKIQKKDIASNYDTGLKKIFTISFGDFQKIVKFNINRKLYYPIVRGTGFNLIELDYPTLSECIKALNNGVKLPNDDIFYDKGIYKFEINKFSWTDQREYFTCERYGISDEDTEFYTKSNMLP
jgi:uncharacterized protein YjbI with pentapeptide repeats